MSIISGDLVSVKLDIFKSGMKIDYSIYREKNREFYLLCKDVVLTDELIERFKDLTYPHHDVYIPGAQYDNILREKNKQKNKLKRTVFKKSYEQTKQNTSKMLDRISKENSVPIEVAEELSKTMHKQIETMEISHIIQSINSVRQVDEQLHTHSVNVALLNGIIGKWLKLDKHDLAALVMIGLLHDIGKLKIPQDILNKPSKLNKAEFELMMKHPIYSSELLENSGFTDERILQGVIQHHERVNGMGYPYGLNIGSIIDFARITAISDVYETMITKKDYKGGRSPFEVLSWFAEGCYSELDFNYVMAFLESMVEELKGKRVRLSNGKAARVMFLHVSNFAYPIVELDGDIIHTSEDIKCVSIIDE